MITKERIIGTVMGVVFLATLAGAWLLPKPYSHYAGIICMTWFATMYAYSLSLKSKKSKLALLKNVVVAAASISAVSIMYYGEPTYTDDYQSPYPAYHEGRQLDDGFDVTFKQRVASGIPLFLEILFGGLLGVQAAFLLRPKVENNTEA